MQFTYTEFLAISGLSFLKKNSLRAFGAKGSCVAIADKKKEGGLIIEVVIYSLFFQYIAFNFTFSIIYLYYLSAYLF